MDSLRRASIGASAAIDTSIGIDDILGVAFGDSLIGAFVDTGSTLDTIVADYVSHSVC